MKKTIIAVSCIVVVLAILTACTPCRRRSRWYPVEGGYVNLDRVATVQSVGKLVLKVSETTEKKDILGRTKEVVDARIAVVLLDGPVTAESVAAAKQKLSEAPEGAVPEGGARLRLDNFKVPFAPVPADADAAALSALLDAWLVQAQSVERYVK